MVVPLVIVALCAPAQARSEPEPPESTAAAAKDPRASLETVWLEVDGVDEASLAALLRLRVPHVQIRAFAKLTDEVERDGLYVYVDVSSRDDASYAITLIVSDGRAYDRRVTPDPDDPARDLANNVANLLLGIEDGTVAPDRGDVEIPARRPTPDPPTPTESAARQPPPPTLPPPQPAPPILAIGLDLNAGAVLNAGNEVQASSFGGPAGGIRGLLRLPGGATFGLGLRFAGRGHGSGLRLFRSRVAVGAGYVLRARGFEFEATGWGVVEPFVVLRDGQRLTFDTDPERRTAVVLGGALRLSPGYRLTPRGDPRVSVRFGATFEGSYSVTTDGNVAAVARGAEEDRDTAFRVGGLEFFVGGNVTIWFDVARRR